LRLNNELRGGLGNTSFSCGREKLWGQKEGKSTGGLASILQRQQKTSRRPTPLQERRKGDSQFSRKRDRVVWAIVGGGGKKSVRNHCLSLIEKENIMGGDTQEITAENQFEAESWSNQLRNTHKVQQGGYNTWRWYPKLQDNQEQHCESDSSLEEETYLDQKNRVKRLDQRIQRD